MISKRTTEFMQSVNIPVLETKAGYNRMSVQGQEG